MRRPVTAPDGTAYVVEDCAALPQSLRRMLVGWLIWVLRRPRRYFVEVRADRIVRQSLVMREEFTTREEAWRRREEVVRKIAAGELPSREV
jgi:hypothetical protein